MDEYIASGVVFNSLDEGKVIYGTVRGDLIRCKDCKHYLAGQYCLNIDDYSKPTDFCSWAERKDKCD